jgi:hypothetical protein
MNSEKNWWDKSKPFVEIVGLVLLAIYTAYTIKMYRANKQAADAATTAAQAAKDANKITKNSLLYVQRAFIFVTTFDVTRLTDPSTNKLNGSMRFAFSWENGGTTPTRDMITHISERWFAKPLPENFGFPDYPENSTPFKMFVGPKATNRSSPIFVPAHDISAIRNHSGHLYFWGWARYRDVFTDTPEHVTRFCTEITDVIGALDGPSVNLQTANCNRGNCYDDECKE